MFYIQRVPKYPGELQLFRTVLTMQSNIMGKGSYFVTHWRSTLAERWVSRTLLKHKSKSAVFTLRVIQLFRGGMQSSLRVFVPLQEAVFGMVASIAAIKGNEPTAPHSTQRCAHFLFIIITQNNRAHPGGSRRSYLTLVVAGLWSRTCKRGRRENRGHRGDTEGTRGGHRTEMHGGGPPSPHPHPINC